MSDKKWIRSVKIFIAPSIGTLKRSLTNKSLIHILSTDKTWHINLVIKRLEMIEKFQYSFTGKDHSGVEVRGLIVYKKDELGYMAIEIKI